MSFGYDVARHIVDVVGCDAACGLSDALALGVINIGGCAGVHCDDVVFRVERVGVDVVAGHVTRAVVSVACIYDAICGADGVAGAKTRTSRDGRGRLRCAVAPGIAGPREG